MNEITYRPFRAETDFEAAARLHQMLNTLEGEMGAHRETSLAAGRLCLEDDVRLVGEEGGEILVAELGGTVIGYCSHHFERRGPYVPAHWQLCLYVKNLMIDEAHRGRGIGTVFLEMAEHFARKSGVKLVCLGVVAGNGRAEATYRKQGYRPISFEMAKELD